VLKVLELETRHGFGFAVRAALEHVRTKYVLIMQHDRPFTKRADVPRVLAAMEAHPERLKYVGMPTSTTVTHQSHVLSKYRIHIEPWQADDAGLLMMPLIQWYDSTHICEVEYYRKFVFGPRKLVARGGFIEDKFGQAQLADIRARGVEVSHRDWGTFIAAGSGFAEPVVGHLDGRDALNASKFVWTKAEADESDVLQQQEVASRLALSAMSGQAPSVSTAAAMAAEAARLRVAESKRRQAELDSAAGKDVARQLERPPASKATPLSLPKDLWNEYYVDNTDLKADTPGLGFRNSKHLEDRAGDAAVEWGSTVMGVDLGDGWLRVHSDRYLPTHLGGKRVLSLADGRGHRATASPPPPAPQQRPRGAAVGKAPAPFAPGGRAATSRNGATLATLQPGLQPAHGRLASADLGAGPAVVDFGATPAPAGPRQNGVVTGPPPRRRPLTAPPTGPPPEFKVPPARGLPTHSWQYIDPKGNMQGPFGLPEMRHWYSKRYFSNGLLMRCAASDRFVPFSELFPPPLVPFQDAPLRPSPLSTAAPQH